MSKIVIVHTRGQADYLVSCLPNIGLGGTALDDETVLILDLAGSDPEDVAYEIEEYGDRFGVTRTEIVESIPRGADS